MIQMIQITFPDGNTRSFEPGINSLEIARSISEGLSQKVLAAKVNGEVWDLLRPILKNASLQLLTWEDKDGKSTFWHSSAHLMAEALEALFPGIKFGTGPAIESGFYYDVDAGSTPLSSEDFVKIENEMIRLARLKNQYLRKDISKEEAVAFFSNKGDEYKLELIEKRGDESLTLYTQGQFTDLCKGPHLPDTGYIKAVKLTKLGGAYWQGDDTRPQLTRIYGISFPKQKDLTEYEFMMAEAKKRDHRKLGAELELFMFSELVGPGLPIWLPKGNALRDRLMNFLKEEQEKRGYQLVTTPHIGRKELYVTSGHYAKYGKDSFQPIHTPKEDEEFLLKPMNCPHHCEIFAYKPHSYRDLPMRIAEFGTVYRYEQSGELHGLSRVRGFTQDDAHIFCTSEQVKEEFLNVLDLTRVVLKKMGFQDFTAQISLRDPNNAEKYIGSNENWENAERAIMEAAEEAGLKTVTELGEAAFYGPKLDFMVKDALGRSWQLGTIQVDYNLPERFNLSYTGADNKPYRPVMIHRAPFGSMERFISIMIENTAGKFPLWLTSDQFAVLPISDRFIPYCKEIVQELAKHDIRGFVDERAEKIGRKIRDAEVQHIPFMLVVGEQEQENKMISVRRQGQGDLGSFSAADFVTLFRGEMEKENV
jgi:threonyl-tRNA synthetase